MGGGRSTSPGLLGTCRAKQRSVAVLRLQASEALQLFEDCQAPQGRNQSKRRITNRPTGARATVSVPRSWRRGAGRMGGRASLVGRVRRGSKEKGKSN